MFFNAIEKKKAGKEMEGLGVGLAVSHRMVREAAT